MRAVRHPPGGYDTASLASDLAAVMDALGHRRFAVAGHDTGMRIGCALAADHPDRVARLAVAEAAMPGVSPSPPLFGTAPANDRLWHFAFSRRAEASEQLVTGREDVYFGFRFAKAANKLPDDAVRLLPAGEPARQDEDAGMVSRGPCGTRPDGRSSP